MAVDGSKIAGSRSGGGERVRALGRRRAAAASGDAARDRAGGLGFVHSLHREVVRATGKLAKAARPAEARRRRRLTRWGGGATPATAPRCYSPRARQQAAPASSSPYCTTPEQHLDGRVAATVKNGGGGELGFRRLGLGFGAASRVQVRDPRGGGTSYKGQKAALACGTSMGRRARGRHGRESDSTLSPARPRVGDDRRAPPIIGRGAGERQGGLAAAMWVGWAELGRGKGAGLLARDAGPWLAGRRLGYSGLLRGLDRGLLLLLG
jgi:hypothetical protein